MYLLSAVGVFLAFMTLFLVGQLCLFAIGSYDGLCFALGCAVFTVDGRLITKTEAAFYCSMMWLGLAVGSPLFGILSTMVKNKVLPLILSAGLGILAFAAIIGIALNGFALGFALFVAGTACAGQGISFSLVRDHHEENVRGAAMV